MIPDDVTVQVLTQSREHIIKKTFESLKGVKNAIVHLYNSTSVAQREQVFKKSKQEIIDIAVSGAELFNKISEEMGVNYRVGNILSSDMFYDDANSGMEWAKMGVLGVEMESAALYCNAARAGKKALCICTVSDSFIYPEENTTAEERQVSFTKMMEIALNIAEE